VPRNIEQWAYFVAAVFVAGIVINTIARRVPAVQQIAAGF
jgi:hypothetical protein